MTPQTKRILCGKCHVGLEGPAEPHPEDLLACPSCGTADRFEKVMASVAAHAEHLLAHELQDAVKRNVRGREDVQFSGEHIRQRTFPFISE